MSVFKSASTVRQASRVKKILEQLSRTPFFTGFEITALFHCYIAWKKRAGFSNPVKNRVLESCSNIFFPLETIKKRKKRKIFPWGIMTANHAGIVVISCS